jgi:hypothetical protein
MPSDIHIGSGAMVALPRPRVRLANRNLINMAMRVSDNSAADIPDRVEPENDTTMKMLGLDSIRVDRSTLEISISPDSITPSLVPCFQRCSSSIPSILNRAKADDDSTNRQGHSQTRRHESSLKCL